MSMINRIHVLVLLFLLIFNINTSLADVWLYKPVFWAQGVGDDNRNLRSSNEKGSVGVNGRAGVELTRKADASEIYLRGILNSRRFDGGDDRGRDTDDQLFYTGGSWQTERSQFSINGDYLRQSTSITELEDSGRIQSDERKITSSISPNYSYTLFEDTQIFVGGRYTDVEFPGGDPVGFNEYDVKSANTGVTYSIDELHSITFTGYYQDYNVKKSIRETESAGGMIRFDKILNERWNAFLGFGYRKSNFRFEGVGGTERDSDTGAIYEGGITYDKSELDRFSLNVNNSLQPSSQGNVNERLSFEIDYVRQLSPRLTGVADFLWLENKSVNQNNQGNDREYWQSRIGVDYRLTEKWSLTGRYRHRFEEYLDRPNSSDARSNAILIGIRLNERDKRI